VWIGQVALLRSLHAHHIIHRDVKPENFVMGLGADSQRLFLVDFGLSKKFVSQGQHIAFRSGKHGLTGTARYASIHTHSGQEQSRRDDMESVGYVLVYFLKGRLPWQGLRFANKEEKFRSIANMKGSFSLAELCRDLPGDGLLRYMQYVRGLGFEEEPNYQYCIDVLRGLVHDGLAFDYLYDWNATASSHSTDWNSPKRERETVFSPHREAEWGAAAAPAAKRTRVTTMVPPLARVNVAVAPALTIDIGGALDWPRPTNCIGAAAERMTPSAAAMVPGRERIAPAGPPRKAGPAKPANCGGGAQIGLPAISAAAVASSSAAAAAAKVVGRMGSNDIRTIAVRLWGVVCAEVVSGAFLRRQSFCG